MSFKRVIHSVEFYFDFSDWGKHSLQAIEAAERAAALLEAEDADLVQEAHELLSRAEEDDEFSDNLYEQPDNPDFASYWRLQAIADQARSEKLPPEVGNPEKGYYAYICLPPEFI